MQSGLCRSLPVLKGILSPDCLKPELAGLYTNILTEAPLVLNDSASSHQSSLLTRNLHDDRWPHHRELGKGPLLDSDSTEVTWSALSLLSLPLLSFSSVRVGVCMYLGERDTAAGPSVTCGSFYCPSLQHTSMCLVTSLDTEERCCVRRAE